MEEDVVTMPGVRSRACGGVAADALSESTRRGKGEPPPPHPHRGPDLLDFIPKNAVRTPVIGRVVSGGGHQTVPTPGFTLFTAMCGTQL